MQNIYGAHITEIILEDEPMPAGFGIAVNGGSTASDGLLPSRDDSVYIISGSSNNFAARGKSNGATTASATSAATNNNSQNAPFGMLPQQLCTIEIPVVKKYTGHCVRLGKKGKGCVAGEHIIPYHLDCL